MTRSLLWKVILILLVLVGFAWAIVPTNDNPEPIRRGLDLKGGTHLVMRVNVGDAVRLETDQASEMLKAQAKKTNLPIPTTRRINDTTFVATLPADTPTTEYERIGKDFLGSFDVGRTPEGAMQFKMKTASLTAIERDTVAHTVETIDNRVNALGVTEPYIAPESGYRIVIQLPGVDDPARVKDIIKTTAQLQFRLVEGNAGSDPTAAMAGVPDNMKTEVDVLPGTKEDALGRAAGLEYYAVRKTVPVTGTDLKNARVQKGPLGQPNVGFSLTPDGARKFGDLTGANVHRRLAIVLDNKVVSAPVINSQITDSGVIEGTFTPQQAADLSLVLRSGSLPASLTTLEERTVGPSLGRDSIRQGVLASLIGFIALVLSVLVYYKGAGINAVLALLLNLVILLGMMAIFHATLTLPGIAGIILTLGMAIDSNVLVFERIREELRDGKLVRAAIENGFSRAFGTIIDTHMTTIISALFLFQFGTGPIKGFAVTLLIGLFASVFTAFFVSRVIFDVMYKAENRPTEISI
ncbi:MAG: preprotein translocase subunit SecD [Thermoanaerobaculia bacterium]|nr:preprotein translocase subunit SecD [Thermoanaerobaculia bacterium]